MSLGIGGGTSTQNTNQSSNILSTGSTAGTTSGTTSKNLTPYQSMLQSPLFTMVQNMISNPSQTVAPLIQQAKNSITSAYSGAANALRQKFMGTTGGGASGKYGTGVLQSQLAQQGDLANADVAGAAQAEGVQQNALNLGSNLLAQNFGQTATGTTSGTTSGSQSGTSTGSTTGTNLQAGLKVGA